MTLNRSLHRQSSSVPAERVQPERQRHADFDHEISQDLEIPEALQNRSDLHTVECQEGSTPQIKCNYP